MADDRTSLADPQHYYAAVSSATEAGYGLTQYLQQVPAPNASASSAYPFRHVTRKRSLSAQLGNVHLQLPVCVLAILFTVVPVALLSIDVSSTFLHVLYSIVVLLWFLAFLFQVLVFVWVLLFDEGPLMAAEATVATAAGYDDEMYRSEVFLDQLNRSSEAHSSRLSLAKITDLYVAAMFTFAGVYLLFWTLDSSPSRDSQFSHLCTAVWRAWIRSLGHSVSSVALVGSTDVEALSIAARVYDMFVQLYAILFLVVAVSVAGAIVLTRIQAYKALASSLMQQQQLQLLSPVDVAAAIQQQHPQHSYVRTSPAAVSTHHSTVSYVPQCPQQSNGIMVTPFRQGGSAVSLSLTDAANQ